MFEPDVKFSRHVHWQLKSATFKDNIHIGAFVRTVATKYEKEYPSLFKVNDEVCVVFLLFLSSPPRILVKISRAYQKERERETI